jgi:hypothetical protein
MICNTNEIILAVSLLSGEFLQLFPSINFFLAVKMLSRWRLRDIPFVGEDALKDELPLHCHKSVERFVELLNVPFHRY